MGSKSRELRSGYTTGACAAAAAKAAATMLLRRVKGIERVEIPFPDGSRATFIVHRCRLFSEQGADRAQAAIIKDAGDDPDITNGAEIAATVRITGRRNGPAEVVLEGGQGVGRITKPGLAVPVGAPAINPVPRKMIAAAVLEAAREWGGDGMVLEVTISVPRGEELAKKTLNGRLGIIGGISILGTTGIVRPLSEAAWTATVSASFDVAKAMGLDEVVLSTGRTSERAHQERYGLPAEAYAMMGDYVEFSLQDARKHGFRSVHLCAQWAKMVKIAMGTPQTHVRHGALEADAAARFLRSLGAELPGDHQFNTVREVYDLIGASGTGAQPLLKAVCSAARTYCERITGGIAVTTHLVSYEGSIVADSR